MKNAIDLIIRFAAIGFGLALGIVLLGFAIQVFAILFSIALAFAAIFAVVYLLARLYKYLTKPRQKKNFKNATVRNSDE